MVKNFLIWLAMGTAALLVIAIMIFMSRYFTTAIVQIQTSKVTPTVTCAKIVTSDGVALDCWKEEKCAIR
jgi:hypothetical protein